MAGQIIDTRIVNALFSEAKMSAEFADLVGELGGELGGVGGEIGKRSFVSSMAAVTETYGGLWVGGKATLTDEALGFEPNALNRMVHEDGAALRVELALGEIDSVRTGFGWFTGIIDIGSKGAVFTLRCYGSKAFAQKIGAAAGVAVTAG